MIETIPGVFFSQVRRYAARTALLVKRGGRYQPISWSTFGEQVERTAWGLLSAGIRPGDCVALLSENRPEWAIADLAIQSVGAITVPIYASETTPTIQYILQDCQSRLLILSTEAQYQKIVPLLEPLGSLETVVVLEPVASLHRKAMRWEALHERGKTAAAAAPAWLTERLRVLQPSGCATVIYTSGTTGQPKGVMLSHANFLSNCLAAGEAVRITEHDVHLSFLPLSHVFERMAGCYLPMWQGAVIAYAESMDTVPENMREVCPTMMLGVPRFFEKLHARVTEAIAASPPRRRRLVEWALRVGRQYQAGRQGTGRSSVLLACQRALADRLVYRALKRRLGGRLRFFISGSAPLNPAIAEFFASAGIMILEGYGLTETSPVISVNRPDGYRFGSVGRLLRGVEVQIAEDGEILTRGPHVMLGYYHRDEETRAAMAGGWFHTGDIGRFDADGFLCITDRKKDLLKTAGGKFIAPQKVEGLLTADPAIAQAMVYGDREPYPVALIVPQPEAVRGYAQEQGIAAGDWASLLQDQRVRRWYQERIEARQQDLASYERVKRFALLPQEFTQAGGELTPTLKARRKVIAEHYHAILRALYDDRPA